MKTKEEYLKELTIKFEELDSNEITRMKELILMINLKGIINVYDPNKVISMIDYLRGNEEFFNWTSLVEECKTYVTKNPYKEDYNNRWQYINNMIQATKINNFLMEFPDNRISLLAETKFDKQKINVFLSYCLYADYNLCCMQTIPLLLEKILHNLLVSDLTLPFYYPVYEIMNLFDSEDFMDLEDLEKDMLPFFGTSEKFRETFKELSGFDYDKTLIKLKKEYRVEFTPEEKAEDEPVETDKTFENIKCYRCGRPATGIYENDGFWCSWCGEAFNPKDEEEFKRSEAYMRMKKEVFVPMHPTFTCEQCGRVVQPVHRDANHVYHFKGWQCKSCGCMLCNTCHSPTLGQPCLCGSSQFQPIHL